MKQIISEVKRSGKVYSVLEYTFFLNVFLWFCIHQWPWCSFVADLITLWILLYFVTTEYNHLFQHSSWFWFCFSHVQELIWFGVVIESNYITDSF